MDWINLIKNVAPLLGTALGGPLGGVAVNAIGAALNLPNATQDTLKAALNNATSDQLIAIKNAENDFALKMQTLGLDHAEAIAKLNAQNNAAVVKDRISARQMQIATQSIIVPVMAILVTAGYFSFLYFMFFCAIPPDNKDVLNNVIGSFNTAWIMIISFYFGTSFGSQHKDALLTGVRREAR